MKQYSYDIKNAAELEGIVSELKSERDVQDALCVLFEGFSADQDKVWISSIQRILSEAFPAAGIIGASASGEIAARGIYENTTVISALCFRKTRVYTFSYDCSGRMEEIAGKKLLQSVQALGTEVRAVQILSDVKSIDNRSFLSGLSMLPEDIMIFGGGADAMDNSTSTIIFDHKRIYPHGAAAAVFCGADLRVESHSGVGWKSLGRELEVSATSENGMILQLVEKRPAVEIYENYLRISNEEDLHGQVEEFPLVLNRSGHSVVRVPIGSRPDGSLLLGADVKKGEMLKIGYADPGEMMRSAVDAARKIAAFRPEAVLLFCCITRKTFLKEYADTDARPFWQIAPAAGFYTYGEIIRYGRDTETLNCSLVSVGMREGEGAAEEASVEDSYLNDITGHMSVVQRLISFVEATTQDLEEANRMLRLLAIQDKLTGLLNRGETERRMRLSLERVNRGNDRLSVIMMDIDDFKKVNDTYGHDVGDYVLVKLAEILRKSLRNYDLSGRWGGEEFLILLPGTGAEEAAGTADRIRRDIERSSLNEIGSISVSVGITEARQGEDLMSLYRRVDHALYNAKNGGKNQVCRL